jgi:hypothetical protein
LKYTENGQVDTKEEAGPNQGFAILGHHSTLTTAAVMLQKNRHNQKQGGGGAQSTLGRNGVIVRCGAFKVIVVNAKGIAGFRFHTAARMDG